jgi:hypothetical protein
VLALRLLCLTSRLTIFQINLGAQFYWWRKPEYLEKTTGLPQGYTSPWTRFDVTTLVAICTDYTGSCKFNYHTITITSVPKHNLILVHVKKQNIKTKSIVSPKSCSQLNENRSLSYVPWYVFFFNMRKICRNI